MTVRLFAFNNDCNRLISTGDDKKLKIWNLSSSSIDLLDTL